MRRLTVTAVEGMPEIRADDDLPRLVVDAVEAMGWELGEGDVVVFSSKVVSKALGLWADSGDRTAAVAGQTVRVVAERVTGDRLTRIVQSTSGPVMAAAGVDASNTGGVDGLLLLPSLPDAEAARLRYGLMELTGLRRLGVVVSDTAGRPWRAGQTDFALGVAGVRVVDDLRGGVDADGEPLHVTTRAVADELAAAADLVKGKVDHIPVAVVSGTDWALDSTGPGASELVRSRREDWFDYGRAEAVRASLGVEPGSVEAERVGVAWVGPEPIAARVSRAVAVACVGLSFGAHVDTSREGAVEVGADSAFRAGLVAARVAVALWGEDLDAVVGADAVEAPDGTWHARVTYSPR